MCCGTLSRVPGSAESCGAAAFSLFQYCWRKWGVPLTLSLPMNSPLGLELSSWLSLAMGFFSLVSEAEEALTSELLICPCSAALLTLNP